MNKTQEYNKAIPLQIICFYGGEAAQKAKSESLTQVLQHAD